jgi:hypothetical protein
VTADYDTVRDLPVFIEGIDRTLEGLGDALLG